MPHHPDPEPGAGSSTPAITPSGAKGGGTRRRRPAGGALTVRLLGVPAVLRDGVAAPLPPSRKVRAMLGYLALSPRPVPRSRLCDLLWNSPSDPRGELRWCLSKLRGLLDDGERRRVVASDDQVALDLTGARVDALEVEQALAAEPDPARLPELAELFGGDLLDGVQL